MRSREIGLPSPPTVCPLARALPTSAPAPIAASDVAPRRCAWAPSVAAMSCPPTEKAAIASWLPASKRATRSPSGKSGPARSIAATRTAAVSSASTICEQAQVSARPMPAPNPRRRSRRGAAPGDKLAAIRAIWSAAGSPGANRREPIAAEVAPKTATPVAFAHTMRVPSGRHSQAGNALVASGASRPSRRRDSWNPGPLILRSHLPLRRKRQHQPQRGPF
jgi:hypothetical protein